MVSFNIKKLFPRWLLMTAIIFFILIFIIWLSLLVYEKIYQDKIYQGVNLGEIKLGGLTEEETKILINQYVDDISQEGATFYYQNQQAKVFPLVASVDGGLAYQIISFDTQTAINEAFNFGRNNNPLIDYLNQLQALIFKKSILIKTEFNQEKIIENLKNQLSSSEQPAQNAKLEILDKNLINENSIKIIPEEYGKIINYSVGLNELRQKFASLNNSPIEIKSETDYPTIYKKDCLNIFKKTKDILLLQPYIFKFSDLKWQVDTNQIVDWLILAKNSEAENDDLIYVNFDKQKVIKYLEETIETEINKEPINAKFEIKNGRVIEFQASQDGLKLNKELTFTELENKAILSKQTEINLIIKEEKSYITTENINDFGIKEIIGTGHSNFVGSPANRRHNIKTGADALSGLLINPGQEFSLNSALGTIDASTGYLPELVIKEGKTIPEYGGGLCQIGTTLFRTVLDSGLPITMRRNHSYRVSYYEPAGTDATIYSPWPDFKFINDSDYYILIQSRINGDDIYFDFWGVRDGRVVTKTEPIIHNITKPGPTKYIETLDLPLGEKKCTEHAHNGADAYFDYKVVYQNGEIKEERFSSHYVPWQEVCLIGVEKLSDPSQINKSDTASTTEIKKQN